jgi:AraC-like DNA-binding protein
VVSKEAVMDAHVGRPQAEHAPIVYKTFVPPPPYDGFIENLWYWEGFDPGHAKDTIMASGRIGIMVNLREDALTWYDGERYGRRNRIPGIAVCGTHSTHFAIDAYQASNMGVQFRPGGAFAFFGGSARDFTNAHISLADIWGADAHRLHQRLVQAPTAEEKIAILFRAMVERYEERERHPAVSLALGRLSRSPHRTSVRVIAREAEVSTKRLIHLFAEQVGMTPKLYLRVLRFQRVLERVHTAASVDWMEEVERHGYYDQPHFIREFREFSGFTPTEYFRLRGPYRQHVPLTV